MRIALTTALMVVASIAWADEPTPAETKTPAASEAAPENTEAVQENAAEQATATEQSAAEQSAAEQPAAQSTEQAAETADNKPFKIPPGYRSKRVGGKTIYCSSTVVSGSRFGKEKCRTEQQLREIAKQREAATAPQSQPACSGAVCAKN
jgi:hypothetical protein